MITVPKHVHDCYDTCSDVNATSTEVMFVNEVVKYNVEAIQ